ncbi:hypothetical protein HHI36_022369 [Cryptolaemus montrouzieri]|uniref:Uncharacterized protein n=1 Tax=Cryptolaemus montrouzieri TaxID=559131 RepID=A0ABD2MZS2_9CUCU
MERRTRHSSVSREALPNMREERASAEGSLSAKPGVSVNENLMLDPVAAIRRMRKELMVYVLSEGSKVSKSASERVLGIVAAYKKSKREAKVTSGKLGVNVRREDKCAMEKVVGSD